MSKQISELEAILQQLVGECRRLLELLDSQQGAMKRCDLAVMDNCAGQQEACRLRIAGLEKRRRMTWVLVSKEMKLPADFSLRKLAAAHAPRSAALLKLRDELKSVTQQVRSRAYICGKVANAVLGHLNTVVRVVAGAVEKAGVYNKRGVPRISNRIGVMEAVG